MKTPIPPVKPEPPKPIYVEPPQTDSTEPDPPAWTWFIENPPIAEPPKKQVVPKTRVKLEPLDE